MERGYPSALEEVFADFKFIRAISSVTRALLEEFSSIRLYRRVDNQFLPAKTSNKNLTRKRCNKLMMTSSKKLTRTRSKKMTRTSNKNIMWTSINKMTMKISRLICNNSSLLIAFLNRLFRLIPHLQLLESAAQEPLYNPNTMCPTAKNILFHSSHN